MKVLVACEESQAVCIAFRELGHEAYSCDLEPCSGGHPEWHLQQDVVPLLSEGWDMMIGHPPCTYLSYAGIGWFNIERWGEKAIQRHKDKDEAIEFFKLLWNAPIDKICLENPRGFICEVIKPTQKIHPYYFGAKDKKLTCLWLKNLPMLIHNAEDNLFGEKKTHSKEPEPIFATKSGKKVYRNESISGWMDHKERQKIRSKTFPEIAQAMASQWGNP